ncbi:MAG: hypothetical protein J1E80_02795 [Desulfovibrionaceae bacterium]|nr:hypothetical protein [Desulfovibrionaceae bacterium]
MSVVLRLAEGALLCLALTAMPCLAGGEVRALMRVVPYGRELAPDRARMAAEGLAWLAGLERAAAALAALEPVRLAGLDTLQLQALAAGLGMVEVEAEASVRGENPSAGEGRAVAVARVANGDLGQVSRVLGAGNGYERYEDVIAALTGLIPELMRLAEQCRSVPGVVVPGAQAGALRERLRAVGDEVEAYTLYRAWLDGTRREPELPEFSEDFHESDASGGVPEKGAPEAGTEDDEALRGRKALVEKAFALAPGALPLRLARAELLLREERFRAAVQILENLPPAPESAGSADAAPSMRDRAEARLIARALEARALAQLRSGRPALAERDLDVALTLTPQRASLWLGRGAARQMRDRFGPMCDDYRQACVRGLCRGLAAAHERGQCQDAARER